MEITMMMPDAGRPFPGWNWPFYTAFHNLIPNQGKAA